MTEKLDDCRRSFSGRPLPALDPREGAVIHLEGFGNSLQREAARDTQAPERGFDGVGHGAEILHYKQNDGQEIVCGALHRAQNLLNINAMESAQHPGPAIKRLRQLKKWRLEQLAAEVERHLGKPVNTGNLSRLEREVQGYSNDLLQAIAKAFQVDMADLFESRGQMIPIAGETMSRYRGRDGPDGETLDIRRFRNPGGMGGGVERHEGDALIGHMTVSMKWVQQRLTNITSPKNLEIITGFGDSMIPTYYDGDLMLVDCGVREVDIDNVYVFTLDNKLFIKTLQRRPGNVLRVISDNKKYDPYDIAPDSPHELEILGRVVWAWNGKKL